jgi:hypothetical protein
MKLVPIVLFIFASSFAFSQCSKTSSNRIESKMKRIGTSSETMAAPMFLKASIDYSSGIYILSLDLEFRDIQTLHEGDKVRVGLEDHSSIDLVIDKTSISEPEDGAPIVQNGRIWYNLESFVLDSDQIAKLKRAKITHFSCAGYVYAVKGKSQSMLAEVLDCIEKNL